MNANDNRAVIYVRVSSKLQEDNESLAAQQKVCKDYAERIGLQVVAIEQDVESGAKLERTGLTRVRDMFRQGAASHLIVWKGDRAMRDVAYDILLQREFEKAGVTVHSAKRGSAYNDSAEDDFMRNIERAVSEYERRNIIDRTAMGRRQKVERGAYLGNGRAPYGYRRQGEKRDVMLVIEPTEAETVSRIFTWYVVGDGDGPLGVTEIRRRLSELGVPTPGETMDFNTRRHANGHWNPHTVYTMLRNPTYKGLAATYRLLKTGTRSIERPEEDRVYTPVPAIVSEELWNGAQTKLAHGREMSPRNAKHEYLVGRRIKCECGYRVQGQPSKSDGVTRLYYSCNGREPELTARRCDMNRLRVPLVDEMVWEWLVEHLLDEHNLAIELERQQRDANKDHYQILEDIKILETEFTKIDGQLDRLRQAFLQGLFTAEDVARDKPALDERRKAISERIEQMRQRTEVVLTPEIVSTVMDLAAELREKAEAADFETKRFLIDVLNVEVTLLRDEEGQVNLVISSEIATDALPIVSVTRQGR